MKTAVTLLEIDDNKATRAMAQTIVDQLIEVMPERQGISVRKAVGKPGFAVHFGLLRLWLLTGIPRKFI